MEEATPTCAASTRSSSRPPPPRPPSGSATRATALGIGSTSGTHADGTWIEFLDPDGIAIRVVHSTTLADSFFGVVFGPDGEPEFYDSPRVQLPPPVTSAA